MASLSGINTGQIVTFKLFTKYIPDVYKNVKVLGIMSFEIASQFTDVSAIHANIISTLPEGTPKNAEDYQYLYVELIDGTRQCVGETWIADNITVVSAITIHVKIHDGSTGDLPTLRKALNGYGFTNFEIETS